MSLHLEKLESRLLLAAGVTFSNGILTITGGDFDDDVLVEGTGPGGVTVTADLDGIAGDELMDLAFQGVTEIRLNLGLGDDFYDIEGVDISGSLKITDLSGDNDIFVDDLGGGGPPNTIGGNVEIKLGVGSDEVNLIQDTVVRGNVTINDAGGDGNNIDIDDTDIFGNLNVMLGSGSDDDINLDDSDVHGNVTLTDKGGDDNSIDINNKGPHDLGIGGKLTIQTGKGNGDTQFIFDSRVGNGTDLKDLGGNDNTITIYVDNVLIGPTNVSTGNGNQDLIEVVGGNQFVGNVKLTDAGGNNTGRTIDFGGDNLIAGNLDLKTGAGRDFTDISPDNIVHGKTTITDAGGGDNRVEVSDLTTQQLSITTGNGSELITITGSTIAGGLSVNSNAGADLVTVSGNTVVGAVVVNTGAGNDDATFAANRFAGGLQVSQGAGDDELDVFASNFILGRLNFNGGDQTDRLNLLIAPTVPPALIRNYELFLGITV